MGSIPRAQELDLAGGAGPLAAGLAYLPHFIEPDEERALLAAIQALPLIEAPYKAYTAKRRIASFGSVYDFGAGELKAAAPIPEFLFALRDRAAALLGVPHGDVPHALVTEYRPGTPLGWHRDTPEFGMVAGISLLNPARMRFRRYPQRKGEKILDLELAPRSAYALRDEVRWNWQHSIAATRELRYSITFRTLR